MYFACHFEIRCVKLRRELKATGICCLVDFRTKRFPEDSNAARKSEAPHSCAGLRPLLRGPLYARPALRPSASCLPNSGMAPIMPAKAMPSETSTKEPTRAGPRSMSSASSYVGTNCFSPFLLILSF